MSIQLNIYWQQAQNINWFWSNDDQQYQGTLEDLLDQVKTQNLESVSSRVFLPSEWFTTFPLPLPKGSKRISAQMIGFAAEEFLAQDIEDVHLVMVGKPINDSVMVTATAKDSFFQVIQTLKSRQLIILEAYDAGQFVLPSQGTHDIELLVEDDKVILRSGQYLMEAHHRGFPQWFEHWLEQSSLDENATIILYSSQTDGPVRNLVTSLETNGHKVQWIVQEPTDLAAWQEQVTANKTVHNLITANLRPHKSNTQLGYWLPATLAAALALFVWGFATSLSGMRVYDQVNQTWAASETIFKQVFGAQKRIQRPLMVREMRSLAASQSSGQSVDADDNAISLLSDLTSAEASLLLEDFRYNQNRHEATFTLVSGVDSDAFNYFEQLKTNLISKGYQVEYSASQDRDAVRAKFKSVRGG